METFSILFGACCVVPAVIALSLLLLVAHRKSKVSATTFWILLGILWAPVMLAAASMTYYILVEEPNRIKHGLPI